jgi:hypothetical protein
MVTMTLFIIRDFFVVEYSLQWCFSLEGAPCWIVVFVLFLCCIPSTLFRFLTLLLNFELYKLFGEARGERKDQPTLGAFLPPPTIPPSQLQKLPFSILLESPLHTVPIFFSFPTIQR